MDNSIHFPDIAQKLIAKALSLGGAFHQPRYIHEFDHCGGHLFGLVHIPQQLQTLIRHRHDPDIGVYGAKGIICRFRSRPGQRIE